MSDSTLKSTVRQRCSHKITAYISMSLSLLVSKTQSSPMSLENQQFLRITRTLVIFFKEHFNYCQFLDRQEHFQLLNAFEFCLDTRWKLSNPFDTTVRCLINGYTRLSYENKKNAHFQRHLVACFIRLDELIMVSS